MMGSISISPGIYPTRQVNVKSGVRFGHTPVPPQPAEDGSGPKKPNNSKIPYLYSFLEGSAVIGALYGVMELTERNPEYFSDRPGMKLAISVGLFGLHQLSHLGLFLYGMRVGQRAEKEKHEVAPPDKSEPPKS